MILLLCNMVFMLLVASGLFIIPCRMNNFAVRSPSFLIFIVLFWMTAISIYLFSTNLLEVDQWITHGKMHYQLVEEFEKLGGVQGATTRLKDYLKMHPNDSEAKRLLDKLVGSS